MMIPLLLLLWVQGVQPAGFIGGKVLLPTGMPASGVRVFAVAVRDVADASAGTVLESIAQTDAMGRYKLEVSPGRYYVAAGSVEQPTYFPGTAIVKDARVITVAANTTVDAVDFSRFVAATRSPTSFLSSMPAPTGVLSGVIRFSDGSPAAGQRVTAVPINGTTNPSVAAQLNQAQSLGLISPQIFFTAGGATGPSGNYSIGVPPGTYYVATGYVDSPWFYPGVGDPANATTVTATTGTVGNLDFTMPAPPAGTTVSGVVRGAGDQPATGGTVALRTRLPIKAPVAAFLPTRPERQVTVGADGSFELSGTPPGTYVVEARLPGVSAIGRNIEVADQPISGVDFTFQVAVVSGQVVWEDGSPFLNAQSLGDTALTTINNPNFMATTLVTFDSNGKFRTVLDATEYRFYFRTLPDEYTIKTITSDGVDLLKQPLHVGKAPVNIDIRIAKTSEADRSGPKVSGRVLDTSGAPAAAERIQLCCFNAQLEQVSTRISPDGSFEFIAIPAGRYVVGLRGPTTLYPVPSVIDVDANGTAGLTIVTTRAFAPVTFSATVDGRVPPAGFRSGIAFIAVKGPVRVSAEIKETPGSASLPGESEYTVVLPNVPAGYIIKSLMAGSIDLLRGGRLGPPGNAFGDVRIEFERRQ